MKGDQPEDLIEAWLAEYRRDLKDLRAEVDWLIKLIEELTDGSERRPLPEDRPLRVE